MSLEEYFATGPAHERPIFEAVMAHLRDVGLVHVEPLSVGIFLKRSSTFATLRPMSNWVALSFSLHRQARHKAIKRKVVAYSGRYFHVANLTSADDFDQELRDLLTEAYMGSPE